MGRYRSGDSHRRGGGNAPFGFQFLHEIGDLNHRRVAQLLYNVCFV
jgi:hypothetical protein